MSESNTFRRKQRDADSESAYGHSNRGSEMPNTSVKGATAPNKESYCRLSANNINAPELQLFDIKNQRLQHIYNEERDELEKNFQDVKKIFDTKTFKYEVLIAFWLCIHLERLDLAQLIHEQDPILEKILQNMRKGGKELLDAEKAKKDNYFTKLSQQNPNAMFLKKSFAVSSASGSLGNKAGAEDPFQVGGSTKGGPRIRGNQSSNLLINKGKNGPQGESDISMNVDSKSKKQLPPLEQQTYGLDTDQQLLEIQFLLKSQVGLTFNTNVMRIALNMQEEKIAKIRMEIEQSEATLFLAGSLYLIMWFSLQLNEFQYIYICNQKKQNQLQSKIKLIIFIIVKIRRSQFKIPTTIGYLMLSTFTFASIYLQCVIVTQQGPVPLYFYLFLHLGDQLFGFIYILFNNYIYPSGFYGFAVVPKVVFTLAFFFYYDDRLYQILYYALLTICSHLVQGLAAEELLCDSHNENITEFGAIDYYVILNMDLLYVYQRAFMNGKDHIKEYRDWLFANKSLEKLDASNKQENLGSNKVKKE